MMMMMMMIGVVAVDSIITTVCRLLLIYDLMIYDRSFGFRRLSLRFDYRYDPISLIHMGVPNGTLSTGLHFTVFVLETPTTTPQV